MFPAYGYEDEMVAGHSVSGPIVMAYQLMKNQPPELLREKKVLAV